MPIEFVSIATRVTSSGVISCDVIMFAIMAKEKGPQPMSPIVVVTVLELEDMGSSLTWTSILLYFPLYLGSTNWGYQTNSPVPQSEPPNALVITSTHFS